MKIDKRAARRRVRLPEPDALARQFVVARVAIGAVIVAAPVAAARSLGADSATAQRVNWLTRMMGARDGLIGLGGTVAARTGGDPAPWLLCGAVADAVDAAALATALKQGRVKGVLPSTVVVGAAVTALVGAVTALRVRRR